MKKSSNFFKKMFAVLSLALPVVVVGATSLSVAAFVGLENNTQSITVNMKYSSYFAGGSGTKEAPYLISNPQQLRNFSYLVNLGLFGNNDYFALGGNIDYSSETTPLIPIGNHAAPFRSHFTGAISGNTSTVYYIKGLKVVGDNLMDVGMFGFIDANASIDNFALLQPRVTSTGDRVYSFATLDKNPARTVITENDVKTITIPENTIVYKDSADTKLGLTGFNITYTLPKTYMLNGVEMPLEYSFNVSNPSVASITDDKNGTATVKILNNNDTYNDKTNPGYYFTIDISTSMLVRLEEVDASGQGTGVFNTRHTTFTLEAFKFYYDVKNHNVISDEFSPKIPKKLMYPKLEREELNSSQEKVYDHSHALYVGVVCGHLNGKADRIAVYQPTLDIKRPFISNSILIGKRIDDDNKSTLSREDLDVNKIYTTENPDGTVVKKDALTFKFIPGKMVGAYSNTNNADVNLGNRYIADIYDERHGFTMQSENTLRFYGNQAKKNSSSGNDSSRLQTAGGVSLKRRNLYTDDLGNPINKVDFNPDMADGNSDNGEYKSKEFAFISYEDTFNAWMQGPVEQKIIGVFPSGNYGYTSLNVSNAIQFWVSAANNSSIVQQIFSSGIDFYLTIEMDYLLFDDAPKDVSNNSSYKHIDFLGCSKAIDKGPLEALNSGNVYYKDSVNNADINGATKRSLDLLKVQGATVPQNKGPYPYGEIVDPENDALSSAELTKKCLFDYDTEVDGTVPAANDDSIYTIKTKKFKIKSLKRSELGLPSRTAFYPNILMGIKDYYNYDSNSPTNKYAFNFDILKMNVMISDINGNFTTTLGTIDFSSSNDGNLPLNSDGTWKSSNVRVTAKTIQDEGEVAKGSNEFHSHIHSEATNVTEYKIYVTRSDSTWSGTRIDLTYSITGANGKNFIIPKNTKGYSTANSITEGSVN